MRKTQQHYGLVAAIQGRVYSETSRVPTLAELDIKYLAPKIEQELKKRDKNQIDFRNLQSLAAGLELGKDNALASLSQPKCKEPIDFQKGLGAREVKERQRAYEKIAHMADHLFPKKE